MNEKKRELTKVVSGNFGGMIFQLELIHPHINLHNWKSLVKLANDQPLTKNDASANDMRHAILYSVRGPDLKSSSAFFEQSLADYVFGGLSKTNSEQHKKNDKSQQSTVMVMKDGIIDLISLNDGKVLQSLSLDHLKEAAIDPFPQAMTIGRIAHDSQLTKLEEHAEMRASIIHYCPYSHFILVGYYSGTIGILPFQDTISQSKSQPFRLDFSYLRTNQIHDAEITLLKTFRFRYYPKIFSDPVENDLSKDIVVAIVGDAHGNLSLWQISPARKKTSPLLYHVRQHTGKILAACICEIPGNIINQINLTMTENIPEHLRKSQNNNSGSTMQNILLTSCDKGMTYAWRMEKNLQLQIIAYYQSTHLPAKQSSFIAIPKMIYRKVLMKSKPTLPPLPHESFLSLQLQSTDQNKIQQGLFASKSFSSFNFDQSHDNSSMEEANEKEIAVLCYEVYCVIGFTDGFFEVWALSSDSQYCSLSPIISIQEFKTAITSISLYNSQQSSLTLSAGQNSGAPNDLEDNDDTPPQAEVYDPSTNSCGPHGNSGARAIPNSIVREFSLVNQPLEESESIDQPPSSPKKSKFEYLTIKFQPAFDQDIFLTGYQDGTILIYRLTVNFDSSMSTIPAPTDTLSDSKRMSIEKLSAIRLPSTLSTLLPYPVYSPKHQLALSAVSPDWDYLFISDFNIYEFLPLVTEKNVLNTRWHQSYKTIHQFFEKYTHRLKKFTNTREIANPHTGLVSSSNLNTARSLVLTDRMSSEATSAAISYRSDVTQVEGLVVMDPIEESVNEFISLEEPSPLKETRIMAPSPDRPAPINMHSYDKAAHASSQPPITPGRTPRSARKRKYIGSMESMQRIMSAELHQAKKDKRLIELFTHKLDQSADGTVSIEQAIDIIYLWVLDYQSLKFGKPPGGAGLVASSPASGSNKHNRSVLKRSDSDLTNLSKDVTTATQLSNNLLEIKKDNLKELFHLLDFDILNDRLKFIELAKVAAITMSAVEKSAHVVTNSPGERVSTKVSNKNNHYYLDDSEASSVHSDSSSRLGVGGRPPIYNKLRAKTFKVSYNSMGEKVYEKVSFSKETMGVPNGFVSALRKMFYTNLQTNYNDYNHPIPALPLPVTLTGTLPETNNFPLGDQNNKIGPKIRQLKIIPFIFQKLVGSKMLSSLLNSEYNQSANAINHYWTNTPSQPHFFDLIRTIRIARSILDMRNIEQYELLHDPKKMNISNFFPSGKDESPDFVSSIPKMLIQYFERQFGECSKMMNVTRYKIINYLEACHQYSQYAIIHLFKHLLSLGEEGIQGNNTGSSPMQSFSCSAPPSPHTATPSNLLSPIVQSAQHRSSAQHHPKSLELAVWLITEARNLLLSRGCVVVGGVIQPSYDDSGTGNSNAGINNFDNISISSTLLTSNTFTYVETSAHPPHQPTLLPTTGANDMRWQYISKADALYVCDELLRIRGKMGPHMYVTVLHLIDLLPSATLTQIQSEDKAGILSMPALDSYGAPNISMFGLEGVGVPEKWNLENGDNRKETAEEKMVNNPNELMIDLEKFLEILYFEFLHQDRNIRLQKGLVFGSEYSTNNAVTAKARSINEADQSKRPLVLDDDAGSFGPYHAHNLSRIHDILHLFMRYDPLRSGEIDPIIGQKMFVKILLDVSRVPAAYTNILNAEKIIQLAKEKTKITSIEDKLSYIDVIAVLLAWEEQNSGVKPFLIDELVNTINYIERSIDTHLAKDLIKYFTCVSALENYENPLWVIGLPVDQPVSKEGFDLIDRVMTPGLTNKLTQTTNVTASSTSLKDLPIMTEQTKTLSIPLDGEWRLPKVNPPDDRPGLLHVKPVILEKFQHQKLNHVMRHVTAIREAHRKEMEYNRSLIPLILRTNRAKESLFGETAKPISGVIAPHLNPAPIHILSLNDEAIKVRGVNELVSRPNVDAENDLMNQNVNNVYYELYSKYGESPVRTSYSRVIEHMDMNSILPSNTDRSHSPMQFSPIAPNSPSAVNDHFGLLAEGSISSNAGRSIMDIHLDKLMTPSQIHEQGRSVRRTESLDLSTNEVLNSPNPNNMDQYFDENNRFNLQYYLTDSYDSLMQPTTASDEDLMQLIEGNYPSVKVQTSSRNITQSVVQPPNQNYKPLQYVDPSEASHDDVDGDDGEKRMAFKIYKEDSTNSLDSNYQKYDIAINKREVGVSAVHSFLDSTAVSSTISPPRSPTNEPLDMKGFSSPPYVPRASPFHDKGPSRGNIPRNTDLTAPSHISSTENTSSPLQPNMVDIKPFNRNSALTPFIKYDENKPDLSFLGQSFHLSNSIPDEFPSSLLSHTAPSILQHQHQHQTSVATRSQSLNLPPSQNDLISQELSSRVHHLANIEKEFQYLYLEEEKLYLQRRLEKEKMRNQLRRELYHKNVVGMDYYYKALEERYRRLHLGQLFLQKNLEKEKLDKQEKENQIQRILEKNRQEVMNRLGTKSHKDNDTNEKKKIEKELMLMRKEDEAAFRKRQYSKEMERKGRDEKKALEDAEIQERLNALRKKQEEEEALRRKKMQEEEDLEEEEDEEEPTSLVPLPVDVPASPIISKSADDHSPKKTRSKSIFGSFSPSLENFEPATVTPLLSARDDDEKVDETATDTHTEVNTTDDDSRPASVIEEHIRQLIMNIHAGWSDHATHPRKMMKNGKFFIPLMFSDDLEFNPFQSNISQMNDLILQHLEDEAKIAKEEEAAKQIDHFASALTTFGTSASQQPQLRTLSRTGSALRTYSRSSTLSPNRSRTPQQRGSTAASPLYKTDEDDNEKDKEKEKGKKVEDDEDDDALSYCSYNGISGGDASMHELYGGNKKINSNPFDDITQTLQDYRKTMEKKRKLLFATDHMNVPVNEWTPIFRHSHVNWKQFFKKEQSKLDIIKQMGQAILNSAEADDPRSYNDCDSEIEREQQELLEKSLIANLKSRSHTTDELETPRTVSSQATFFSAMHSADDDGADTKDLRKRLLLADSRSFLSNPNILQEIPKTLLESLPKDVKKDVIPLPFGKIAKKEKVYYDKLKFYQLEIYEPHSLLTIELEMIRGSCDLLVNYEKLPSTVKYDHRLVCQMRKKKKKKLNPVITTTQATITNSSTVLSPSSPSMSYSPSRPGSPSIPVGSMSPLSPGRNASRPGTASSNSITSARQSTCTSPNITRPNTSKTAGSHPTDLPNINEKPREEEEEEEEIEENPRNNQIHRLFIEPEHAGMYFIAIHATSSPGAVYNLWAYLSGEKEETPTLGKKHFTAQSTTSNARSISSASSINHHIEKVDDIIKKWNYMLSENTEEDLLLHFPKLEMEASHKVELMTQRKVEAFEKKRAIINEMKELKKANLLQSTLDEVDEKIKLEKEFVKNPDHILETENLEKFVTKVGRYAIRKEREMIVKKTKELLLSKGESHDDASKKSNNSKAEAEFGSNKPVELDFENLFDANDVILQNNNLLIQDILSNQQHQSLSSSPFHKSPQHHSAPNLSIKSPHNNLTLPEKIVAPPNLPHAELFSLPDLHRREHLMMLRPIKDDDPLDFEHEIESLKKGEQNDKRKMLQRQSSNLPVLSIHFSSVKKDDPVKITVPQRRRSSMLSSAMTSRANSAANLLSSSHSDRNLLGKNLKLPQIKVPNSRGVDMHRGSSRGLPTKEKNDSISQASTPFRLATHLLETGNESSISLTPNSLEDDVSESGFRSPPQQRIPAAQSSLWTSLPGSLQLMSSASSPVINLALDERVKKDKARIDKERKEKKNPHLSMLKNPKVINYTLSSAKKST